MFSEIPLDDQIGRSFYINDAVWRLEYNASIRRFALKRVETQPPVAEVAARIQSGELLWNPLDYFEALSSDTSVAAVQQHVLLLGAFLRSSFGTEMADWALRSRLDARLKVYRAWLSRRALPSGDPTDAGGSAAD